MDRVGDARLGIDDRDVDVAVGVGGGDRLGDDLKRDAGVLGAEVTQDRDRQAMRERGRQRDFQYALGPALLLDDLADRLVDAVERFGDDRQDVPPGLGQHELLRAPLEQRHAEKVLQHDDMPADRALRDRETVGGGSEAEMLTGRLERPQSVERQPFAIHRPSSRATLGP